MLQAQVKNNHRGRKPERTPSGVTSIPPPAPSPPPRPKSPSTTRPTTRPKMSQPIIVVSLGQRKHPQHPPIHDRKTLPGFLWWMVGGDRTIGTGSEQMPDRRKMRDNKSKVKRAASMQLEPDAERRPRARVRIRIVGSSQASLRFEGELRSATATSVKTEPSAVRRSKTMRPVIFDASPPMTQRSQSMPPLGSSLYQSHLKKSQTCWEGNTKPKHSSKRTSQTTLHRRSERRPSFASG